MMRRGDFPWNIHVHSLLHDVAESHGSLLHNAAGSENSLLQFSAKSLDPPLHVAVEI
jgi:hypothetical protein